MKAWIRDKLDQNKRHQRLHNVDFDLHQSQTPTRAIRTYAPVLLLVTTFGVLLAHFLDHDQNSKSELLVVQQEPSLRQLSINAHTHNGRGINVVINGRQVHNSDLPGWCEFAWIGKIQQVVGFAGTVEIDGEMKIDDWVNRTDSSLLEQVEYELTGLSFKSKHCTLDILGARVTEL